MNSASTDTKIYRPAEVINKLAVQSNDGARNYTARHSTDNPPVEVVPLPQHVRTELIPVVRDMGETRVAVTFRAAVRYRPGLPRRRWWRCCCLSRSLRWPSVCSSASSPPCGG